MSGRGLGGGSAAHLAINFISFSASASDPYEVRSSDRSLSST